MYSVYDPGYLHIYLYMTSTFIIRENGVTALTYRTTFSNLGDPGDQEIPETGETSVIWAIGRISERAHRYGERIVKGRGGVDCRIFLNRQRKTRCMIILSA